MLGSYSRAGKAFLSGGTQPAPHPAAGRGSDLVNHTWRKYGHRVGIWRILEVFDQHRIQATATINTSLGKRLPRILDELKKRDWELVAHSQVENDLLVNFTGDREANATWTLSTEEQRMGASIKANYFTEWYNQLARDGLLSANTGMSGDPINGWTG